MSTRNPSPRGPAGPGGPGAAPRPLTATWRADVQLCVHASPGHTWPHLALGPSESAHPCTDSLSRQRPRGRAGDLSTPAPHTRFSFSSCRDAMMSAVTPSVVILRLCVARPVTMGYVLLSPGRGRGPVGVLTRAEMRQCQLFSYAALTEVQM